MSWVAHEGAGCRLKDQRLQQRLEVIVEWRGAKPTESIPAACRGWGETQATYRFLSNERIEAEEILEGQSQATRKRIEAEPVVVIVQDTTLLEYLKDVVGKGVGTLRETIRDEHWLHPSVAFTPAGENLGVLSISSGKGLKSPWAICGRSVRLRKKKVLAGCSGMRWPAQCSGAAPRRWG